MKRALSFFLSLVLFASLFTLAPMGEGVGALPEVLGTQINVDETMTLKIFVSAPEGSESAGVYISLGRASATRLYGTKQEDGSYLVTFSGLELIDLTLTFTIVPWSMVDTNLLRGAEREFSIRDYATRLVRSTATTPEARAALIALLNCGTAVQSFLDYRVESLPNAYLTEQERVILPPAFDEDMQVSYLPAPEGNAQNDADFSGITLSQTGSLSFRFYIALADGVSPDGYTVEIGTVKENGAPDFSEAEALEVEATDDGRYLAVSPSLSLLSLREEICFRILAPNGKESDTYFYSVALFVKSALEGDTLTEEERGVLLATLSLSDALVAYEASLAK